MLPGLTDRDLLEYMSRLLAEERLLQRQGSNRISGAGPNWSDQETSPPLITVDELRRMPSGDAILVHGTTRPARIRLRPYYRERRWRHLADRWRAAEHASTRSHTPPARTVEVDGIEQPAAGELEVDVGSS